MEKLKPCPFCGGEAEITETKMFRNQDCYVQCKGCGACTKFRFGDECRKQAIDDWNTRHAPRTPNGAYVPAGNARLEGQKECNLPSHLFDMHVGGCYGNQYCCKKCELKGDCEVVCIEAYKGECKYEVNE